MVALFERKYQGACVHDCFKHHSARAHRNLAGIALHAVFCNGVARMMLRAVFRLVCCGILLGIRSLGYSTRSLDPIVKDAQAIPVKPKPSESAGPIVGAAPLYYFIVLMIWSCPDMTADRLLFNLLWTHG